LIKDENLELAKKEIAWYYLYSWIWGMWRGL